MKVGFFLSFIVLLGGGVAFAALLGAGTFVPTPRTIEQTTPELQTIPIIIEVEGIVYQLDVEPGSSVLESMRLAQETSDLKFEGREFPGLGFFMEEVNGLRQDPRAGEYWIYYINGRKAEVGISAYIVQNNDVISWKYEDEE